MKKYFKYYAICWAIGLIAFNVITFVVTDAPCGLAALTKSFWIGYGFIILMFVGNLVCSILFFKEENTDKVFLNYSVIRLAYGALIASLIAGVVVMIVPAIPYWVGIIIDVLILAFYAIAITKASAAADIVQSRGQNVKQKTSFIKMLTADAQTLVAKAGEDAKVSVNRVYEAIRYSDPMSNDSLASIENQIQNAFNAFAEAVKNNDIDLVKSIAEELLCLINERNSKIRVLK